MQELKIGWASRDVTTEAPVSIPGQFYMRVNEGSHDPLTATVLVIDNGFDLVVLASLDCVVLRSRFLDIVREKVAVKNRQIPVEKIIISATHTHEGASSYDDEDPSILSARLVPHDGVEIESSRIYRDFVTSAMADAICEAYDSRSLGGIGYGYGYAVASHSRRSTYLDDLGQRPGAVATGFAYDGHARMYGKTDDAQFAGYEAGADHVVNVLYTFGPDGSLTGAVVNVPCPSQSSMHLWQVSADYWNEVRSELKKRLGDIHILPQCAAAGDLSPVTLHYKKAEARRFQLKYGSDGDSRELNLRERRDIAERIADAVEEVYAWARKDIRETLTLYHDMDTVWLARRLITDDEYARCLDGLKHYEAIPYETETGTPRERLIKNSQLFSQRRRFQGAIDRYRTQREQPKHPMELHVVALGDIAFVTSQFELYMDYMHRIQARSPFVQTFVVQLAAVPGEGGGSYLATERGARNLGYSATMFCNLVSPQGGQELVEETVARLEKLAGAAAAEG